MTALGFLNTAQHVQCKLQNSTAPGTEPRLGTAAVKTVTILGLKG